MTTLIILNKCSRSNYSNYLYYTDTAALEEVWIEVASGVALCIVFLIYIIRAATRRGRFYRFHHVRPRNSRETLQLDDF